MINFTIYKKREKKGKSIRDHNLFVSAQGCFSVTKVLNKTSYVIKKNKL